MLATARILAHSPVLLHTPSAEAREYVSIAFDDLAQTIQQLGIRHIISLSAHPSFSRAGFSAYIADQILLQFSDFGDLATKSSLAPSWDLYTPLRERGLPIEPISSAEVDYGHAIPLYLLQQRLTTPVRVLCLNDDPSASSEAREKFGRKLIELISAIEAPVAFLCCGDLSLPESVERTTDAHAYNLACIKSIENKQNVLPVAPNHLVAPCLRGPYEILRGMLASQPMSYRSLSLKQSGPVTLFAASFDQAAA